MDTWHQSSSDMQHYTAEEGAWFPNSGGEEATATPDVLLQGHKWRGSGDNCMMTWGWKWQTSAPELLIVTSSRRSEHARTASSTLLFIGQFQSGTVSPPRWRRPAHLISSRAGWSRCAHNSSGTLALWALLSAGFWLELVSQSLSQRHAHINENETNRNIYTSKCPHSNTTISWRKRFPTKI